MRDLRLLEAALMRIKAARASGSGSAERTSAGERAPARQPPGPGMPRLVPSAELVALQRIMQGRSAPAPMAGVPVQREAAPRRNANTTGLPDPLKAGVESLSGVSLDDVKVHYNSERPAQMQAHAYTQGSEIHVAPGEERHLPHEAWHVVQQKQGRVRATRQLKGVGLNDDAGLEREADVMGARAARVVGAHGRAAEGGRSPLQGVIQAKLLSESTLNVVGENHEESANRLDAEKSYCKDELGDVRYWGEDEFLEDGTRADPFDYRWDHCLLRLEVPRMLLETAVMSVVRDEKKLKSRSGAMMQLLEAITQQLLVLQTLTREEDPTEKSTKKIRRSKEMKDSLAGAIDLAPEIHGKLQSGTTGTELFHIDMPLLQRVIELIVTASPPEFSSVEDNTLARSQSMHLAAEKQAKSQGVWKIGERHVQDIKTNTQEIAPGYRLVTKDEFNIAFGLWCGQNQKLEDLQERK